MNTTFGFMGFENWKSESGGGDKEIKIPLGGGNVVLFVEK
jgi:hypothetical protein